MVTSSPEAWLKVNHGKKYGLLAAMFIHTNAQWHMQHATI
jgi:hypothetical protein